MRNYDSETSKIKPFENDSPTIGQLASRHRYLQYTELEWLIDWQIHGCWWTGDDRSLGITLQWRHNGGDGLSNHRRPDWLHNCLFRHNSKKSSKLRVTGLCEVTGGFPLQGASNKENVSIWLRYHEQPQYWPCYPRSAPKGDNHEKVYWDFHSHNCNILRLSYEMGNVSRWWDLAAWLYVVYRYYTALYIYIWNIPSNL